MFQIKGSFDLEVWLDYLEEHGYDRNYVLNELFHTTQEDYEYLDNNHDNNDRPPYDECPYDLDGDGLFVDGTLVTQFRRITIPLIRRIYPQLIANAS